LAYCAAFGRWRIKDRIQFRDLLQNEIRKEDAAKRELPVSDSEIIKESGYVAAVLIPTEKDKDVLH